MLGKRRATSADRVAAPMKGGRKNKNAASFEAARFQDEIRMQAYYRYLWRVKNNSPGTEEADWLQAEKDVMARAR